MTKKRFAEDGDALIEKFNKGLPGAFKKASKEYVKDKAKTPQFDRDEMLEGGAGFIEPENDGIR